MKWQTWTTSLQKKDKKKKGKKGSKFAKANTDILAQNLIENDKKTEDDEKKAAAMLATSEANRAGAAKENTGVRHFLDIQHTSSSIMPSFPH